MTLLWKFNTFFFFSLSLLRERWIESIPTRSEKIPLFSCSRITYEPQLGILHRALWHSSETERALVCLVCSVKTGGKGEAGNPQSLHKISVPEGVWRLDWHNEQCITYQRSSLPCFPAHSLLLHCAPFLLSAAMLFFLCSQSASVSILPPFFYSLRLLSSCHPFLYLTIWACRNLSARASEPVPSCHIDWICLVGVDAPSRCYPTTWCIWEYFFLIEVIKHHQPRLGHHSVEAFSLWRGMTDPSVPQLVSSRCLGLQLSISTLNYKSVVGRLPFYFGI